MCSNSPAESIIYAEMSLYGVNGWNIERTLNPLTCFYASNSSSILFSSASLENGPPGPAFIFLFEPQPIMTVIEISLSPE